jgi:NAD(P)H-dependent flavin oxidoreductase YrpB (nitropropane dioxygenase family)
MGASRRLAHTAGAANPAKMEPTPQRDEALESAWRQRLTPYYAELGIDPPPSPARPLAPFGAEMCAVVIELKPDVVSFHFGLPDRSLVDRIKAAGCTIFSLQRRSLRRVGLRSAAQTQ